MLKYDSTVTVTIPNDSHQIVLSSDPIPTLEADFKKFFTITTDTHVASNKSYVIIGCTITSDRTLRDIKFDTTTPHKFIDWLKKEQVFVESDSLGVQKMVTAGYFFKLHPRLTNRTTLKALLIDELNDIVLDPDLACTLDPSLNDKHLKAMSNGNFFNPEVPPFELYQTDLTYGRDKARIETKTIGIKCEMTKLRLLKEFFAHLSNPMDLKTRIGLFVPTGAVHTIGQEAYTNLICDNNVFINSITMIPLGDFQHATLDIPFSLDKTTDIEQMTLAEEIMDQTWCISVEKTITTNKVLVVTTHGQLAQARKWFDDVFPILCENNISDKIDVTMLKHMTPYRLDKPILMAAATTYAEKLKLRTSCMTTMTNCTTQFTRPPKAKVHCLVVSFDESAFPPQKKTNTQHAQNSHDTPPEKVLMTQQADTYDYKADLQRITTELKSTMKTKFETTLADLDAKFEK